MSIISGKDFFVTWDGSPESWQDYCWKVRLQYEKTQDNKKRYLGPELASRLTGRAWAAVSGLDHERLRRKQGAKYLLKHLQDQLGRTAVPDAGSKLEERC